MVREEKSLFAVSNDLDLGLTVKECERLSLDKDFAACLRGERNKMYKELASDPNRSKVSTIGNLLFCADQLSKSGSFDKAAKVLLDVAKMEGWLEDKSVVNVFGDLSAKDLAQMREKVQKKQAIPMSN